MSTIRYNSTSATVDSECEVLLDALYQRIERDPNTLDQTIVLAPNIDDYVPHIEAVFGDRLPFTIVDQASTAHSSIVPIFLQLLRLPSSRLALSEVLAVLHNPGQRRFNLVPADVTLIERWLEESSVQFEWDGQSKLRCGTFLRPTNLPGRSVWTE